MTDAAAVISCRAAPPAIVRAFGRSAALLPFGAEQIWERTRAAMVRAQIAPIGTVDAAQAGTPGIFPLAALRQTARRFPSVRTLLAADGAYLSGADPGALLAAHRRFRADVTLLYAPEMAAPRRGDCIHVNQNGMVDRLERDCFCQDNRVLGMLAIDVHVLRGLDANADLMDAIARRLSALRVAAFPYRGRWFLPDTPGRYLHAALALHAQRTAAGAEIGGGSTVTNSLLLEDCRIGAGCRLEYVICRAHTRLPAGTVCCGQPDYPYIF